MNFNENMSVLEKLSCDDIRRGVEASIFNGNNLFKDAYYLETDKRFARAYTLYQLSSEEAGKAILLLDLYIHKMGIEIDSEIAHKYFGKINYKEIRSAYYDHKSKSKIFCQLELDFCEIFGSLEINKNNPAYNNWLPIIHKELNSIQDFDTLKNQSLYVSFDEKGFTMPESIITEELVAQIKERANFRLLIACDVLLNLDKYSLIFITKMAKKNSRNTNNGI